MSRLNPDITDTDPTQILFRRGHDASKDNTGSTDPVTIYDYTLPGGTVGQGQYLKIEASLYTKTVGVSGSNTLRLEIDGALVASKGVVCTDATGYAALAEYVWHISDTSQIIPRSSDIYLDQSTGRGALTLDLTTDRVIQFKIDNGDLVTVTNIMHCEVTLHNETGNTAT